MRSRCCVASWSWAKHSERFCRAANASYSAAMYVVVFLVLAALAGLIWFGLQGWERLVRIRREQEPTTT